MCVVETMASCKVPLAYLPKMFVGLVDALQDNFSCLYFELQQCLEGSFSCRNLQWVNKETNGHGFHRVCAFVVIMWSRIPSFLNGECERLD
jgi:hypothetical protein